MYFGVLHSPMSIGGPSVSQCLPLLLSLLVVFSSATRYQETEIRLPVSPARPGDEEAGDEILELIAWQLEQGDLDAARAILSELLGGSVRPLVVDRPSASALAILRAVDQIAERLGDLEAQLAVRSEIHVLVEGMEGESELPLLSAKQDLAVTRKALGDLQGALELEEHVHAARQRLLPPDHPKLLAAKLNLAKTLSTLGDYEGALELEEHVHAVWERLLPADHSDLLTAKQNLSATRSANGDLEGALALIEQVHATRERQLPAEHAELLDAKHNLAAMRFELGDFEGALELFEYVHACHERRLPADHSLLLLAKQGLAAVRYDLGDLEGSLELIESVHAIRERTLPSDHAHLLNAKHNLAVVRRALGDLEGALELEEYVHAARERLLEPDHPLVLASKQNLAISRKTLGDLEGALELEEYVRAARERLMAADHPDVLGVTLNLAVTREALGDTEGALELLERVHAVHGRQLDSHHPDLLAVKQNLAISRKALGDFKGAIELEEFVCESYEQRLTAGHPRLLLAMQNLGSTRSEIGDLEGALELFERVHAAREMLLPANHPDLLAAKQNLALTRKALGDREGAFELSLSIADAATEFVVRGLVGSRREARATARVASSRLAGSRTWSRPASVPTSVLSAYVRALETARYVASARGTHQRANGGGDELSLLRSAAAAAGRELDEHMTSGPVLVERAPGEPEESWMAARDAAQNEWNRDLGRLAIARDAREKELLDALGDSTSALASIDPMAISAALAPNEAAVGLHKVEYTRWEDEGITRVPDGEHYLAYVVTSSGSISEIDLGPAAELDERIRDWRNLLGISNESRGFGGSGGGGEGETVCGRSLRRMLIDPILEAAEVEPGGMLFVCLDDALHTLPLDALPLSERTSASVAPRIGGGEARLGDLYRVRVEVSFARLVRSDLSPETKDSLLVVGGVDYDATGADRGARQGVLEVRALEQRFVKRDAAWCLWEALPGTEQEAAAIAALAREELGSEPQTIVGKAVTSSAIEAAVREKRFVHIATHGWFMPDTIRSMLDHDPRDDRMGLLGTERVVTGFAPMSLCGLVMAGANGTETPEELASCLLTARELSTFDLWGCELAVLSACETNVGIARAGQGIQSLQTALHEAGARASITSLWSVDDQATRDLMRAFYANLWGKEMGKAEALWDAKCQIRRRGDPVRHWAGWVLVGDPN